MRQGPMQIFVLDFDFFTSVGGGQTFYRRVVERHRDCVFRYASRGLDLPLRSKGALPSNALPVPFDEFLDVSSIISRLELLVPIERYYCEVLVRVAIANQGRHFDVVEVPSFFPIAHRIRDLFASFGITVGVVSLGMLGWLSVGLANAYSNEAHAPTRQWLETLEKATVAAADFRYTISHLHNAENRRYDATAALIDMHDVLEEVEAADSSPCADGPPDIWFVGRLDRNKGPDIFLDIVSKLPRRLYARCRVTGPDNSWTTASKWSDHLIRQAADLGVDLEYMGVLGDEELRRDVYRGNSVVIIPSRSDAFNLVALEALRSGCPIVLSNRAGAARFIADEHPQMAPPIIDPDDVVEASRKVRGLLEDFSQARARLREALAKDGFPKPRANFLSGPYWSRLSAHRRVFPESVNFTALLEPAAQGVRTNTSVAAAEVCIIIGAVADLGSLTRTLSGVSSDDEPPLQIVVIDDGECAPGRLCHVVHSLDPAAKIISQAPLGIGRAFNRGLEETNTPFVVFLRSGADIDRGRLKDLLASLRHDAGAPYCIDADTEVTIFRRSAVNSVNGIEETVPDAEILARLIRRIQDLQRADFSNVSQVYI